MTGPEDILTFWIDEVGPKGWYDVDETLDKRIRDTFETTWQEASEGQHALWHTYARGALAYIILTDQFPRNMYRGQGKSFATDQMSLAAAKSAIDKGWDMQVNEPERQFFYLPLMHSESLCDQDRCVRLMCERMPKAGDGSILHARAHREIIREFGRFPYRNDVLDRVNTVQEQKYLASGGYGHTLRSMQQAA